MDEADTVRPWRAAPPSVGAVLVTHDGATWLPKTLASFARMDHAPNAWRVVDVSSTDDGAEQVRASFGAERVVYAPSGTGFGDAVRLGVEALPRTDWLWLLHDDAAVEPGTLAGLLDEATSADDVAVVGPKIREWPSLRRLLEVGLTVTATGRRETGLETGEPDAGQHDRPHDVLAVNTAGMLVRRDVWDELGGFDPTLPLYFDDIDLGWRVARAGYRTRIAPGAVLFHAEASRRGVRRRRAGDVAPWEKRRGALFTLLANSSGARFAWEYVRLFVGSLLRVLGFLVAKDPEAAGDELMALRSVYGHPGELRAARRRRAATARRDNREIRHLFAPWWLPYQHGWDAIKESATALVRPETVETVGRRSTVGQQTPHEQEALDSGPSLWARRPWLVVVLALVALSVVAGRGLFVGPEGSSLTGGALPRTPETAGAWWGLLVERGHEVGLGSTSLPPVFAGLLGAAATPVWFRPSLLVTVLVLMSVPLAALTAHRVGRRVTTHRWWRIVLAISYALAVVATGAVANGRIGTLVALVVAPIIGTTALQLLERPGRQLGLRLGIWVAVAAAFAPVVLPLALLGLVGLVLLDRRVRVGAAVAAVTAVVLLGPWAWQRALHPTRTWWEAGFPLEGAPASLRVAVDLALGRAGVAGDAPAWLGAGLLVLAVLAIVPRQTRPVVLLCWAAGVVALAVAVVGTLVTYRVPGSPVPLTPWVGVPVVLWVLALGTAVLVAAPAAAKLPRPAVVALVVVALVLPVGTAAWWLVRGVDEPLDRARPAVVPAFLSERPGDTLVLTGSTDAGIAHRVVRGAGPFLGQEALRPDPERSAAVDEAVRGLVSAPGIDDVRTLEEVGVGAIYAPRADAELARRLDGAPLLEPAGSERPDSRVWTLAGSQQQAEERTGVWRWILGGAQVVLWLAAIVLTAPVRRRETSATLEEVPA